MVIQLFANRIVNYSLIQNYSKSMENSEYFFKKSRFEYRTLLYHISIKKFANVWTKEKLKTLVTAE